MANVALVVSGFTDNEKLYLIGLAKLLGAAVSSDYVKAKKPILVCSETNGEKYNAAIKWGKILVYGIHSVVNTIIFFLVRFARRNEKLADRLLRKRKEM